MSKDLIDLRQLSKEQISSFFLQNGLPKYRGSQIYEWIWRKGVTDFNMMTNLSIELRSLLINKFIIKNSQLVCFQKSKDGTIKNKIKLYDGNYIESVLIPSNNRTTACVSSQVGCSLDCKFCATSKLKRMRNLNFDEIFDQIVLINNQSIKVYNKSLSNIVFMGMGEPLMNYNNVIKSIKKITSSDGLAISPKRITLSTSGIPKMIKKISEECPKINLALSLHSAIENTRNKIMPFTSNFPLSELLDSVKYWFEKTKKLVTYEYIVWKNINDKDVDIEALINFCKKSPCKVNLINYNAIGDSKFNNAENAIITKYVEHLKKNNISVTIRKSRGHDIDAACGQLAFK